MEPLLLSERFPLRWGSNLGPLDFYPPGPAAATSISTVALAIHLLDSFRPSIKKIISELMLALGLKNQFIFSYIIIKVKVLIQTLCVSVNINI